MFYFFLVLGKTGFTKIWQYRFDFFFVDLARMNLYISARTKFQRKTDLQIIITCDSWSRVVCIYVLNISPSAKHLFIYLQHLQYQVAGLVSLWIYVVWLKRWFICGGGGGGACIYAKIYARIHVELEAWTRERFWSILEPCQRAVHSSQVGKHNQLVFVKRDLQNNLSLLNAFYTRNCVLMRV